MKLKEVFKALSEDKQIRNKNWEEEHYIQLDKTGNHIITEKGTEGVTDFLSEFEEYIIFDKKGFIKSKIEELKSELEKLEKQLSEN